MKILVIDDSKTFRHLLIKYLMEFGYSDIVAVSSAEEALPVVTQQSVNLILCDWHMPGQSGMDFLKTVRANIKTASIPFIMLTTETERSKILEAVKCGIQSYIFKPLSKEVLFQKLTTLSEAGGITPPAASVS
ncbi:MAG: response regulator [Chitinivibrionales bacterium]|nr:response regulator [Chitinivibrionales bacterium]